MIIEAKTRIVITLEGATVDIDSPDDVMKIISSMQGELPPMFGFRDIKGMWVFVSTQKIVKINLVPNEEVDAP